MKTLFLLLAIDLNGLNRDKLFTCNKENNLHMQAFVWLKVTEQGFETQEDATRLKLV